ncbi:MAG: Flp family type IVb pilin [Isosphaeraceae bacterium]
MIQSIISNLFHDDDGTTAAEYAVLLVLICVALIAAITSVGNSTAEGWEKNVSAVTSACTRY